MRGVIESEVESQPESSSTKAFEGIKRRGPAGVAAGESSGDVDIIGVDVATRHWAIFCRSGRLIKGRSLWAFSVFPLSALSASFTAVAAKAFAAAFAAAADPFLRLGCTALGDNGT